MTDAIGFIVPVVRFIRRYFQHADARLTLDYRAVAERRSVMTIFCVLALPSVFKTLTM